MPISSIVEIYIKQLTVTGQLCLTFASHLVVFKFSGSSRKKDLLDFSKEMKNSITFSLGT